jgi:isocitrate/isopropylmalate dehydrogenase
MAYKVCRIPGDGIGHDVMEAANIVLETMKLPIEWVDAEAGWTCWEKYGNTVPEDTWKALESTDCCLFGAITSKPGIPGFRSAILQIRQRFDLYANLRPIKAYPGNPLNYRDDIDLMIFRENTEGLYVGVEYYPLPDEIKKLELMAKFAGKDTSVSFNVFTRSGCNRIMRAAFEYAHKFGKKRVTVVHKANVIRVTFGMWLEEARKIAADYPEIELEEANVDAMAMWLIKQPQIYEVLVCSNMFGDILSDLAGQLVGGLGFASSANVGEKYALFEPTHGSAPKYAGQYKVNPMAMLLSTKAMLDWLGETDLANRLENALAIVVREGKIRTYDLGGTNTTLEIAREITNKL